MPVFNKIQLLCSTIVLGLEIVVRQVEAMEPIESKAHLTKCTLAL